MKNKLTTQQEGTIFLVICFSIIWLWIGLKNNPINLMLFFGCIILGIISTILFAIVFLFMKHTFKW